MVLMGAHLQALLTRLSYQSYVCVLGKVQVVERIQRETLILWLSGCVSGVMWGRDWRRWAGRYAYVGSTTAKHGICKYVKDKDSLEACGALYR